MTDTRHAKFYAFDTIISAGATKDRLQQLCEEIDAAKLPLMDNFELYRRMARRLLNIPM